MTESIKGRLVLVLVLALVATAACSGAASDSVLDNPAAVSSDDVSDSGRSRADSGGHGGKADATADSSSGHDDAGHVADADNPMGDDATVADDAPNDAPAEAGVCPSACGFGMVCCTKPTSFAYKTCVSPFFC